MKIASFNINRRLANLLDWLRETQPDIVCLQETKTADAEFLAEAIEQAGCHAIWRGEERWNGVAILATWEPVSTRLELPGDRADAQSCYFKAAVNGVLIAVEGFAPTPEMPKIVECRRSWLGSRRLIK